MKHSKAYCCQLKGREESYCALDLIDFDPKDCKLATKIYKRGGDKMECDHIGLTSFHEEFEWLPLVTYPISKDEDYDLILAIVETNGIPTTVATSFKKGKFGSNVGNRQVVYYGIIPMTPYQSVELLDDLGMNQCEYDEWVSYNPEGEEA